MGKSDKRDEIVRAALDLFVEQGFHGAPMALIAERAGVGAGTIYRYFENRDILIRELYGELEKAMFPALLAEYDQTADFRTRFLHLGTRLLQYFIAHPHHFRYLEQYHHSPYGVAYRRDKLLGKAGQCDVFRELFEEAAAAGAVKDFPLAILFSLALGPLLAVARDNILGFVQLDTATIVRTIAACWDAITA